jgi:hypothetical protein
MDRNERWLEQVYAGRTKEEAVKELEALSEEYEASGYIDKNSNAKDVLVGIQEDSLNYLTWYTDYTDEHEIPADHFLKATEEELREFAEWLME